MCGICGIVALNGRSHPEMAKLKQMADAMKHRGPDDEGYYVEDRAALGFRRLSIIDLSGGHQPIGNETGTVWVVLNGEVFNYRQLQKELRQKGHDLRTASDTEVIVHGYEEWGDEVLEHLNGMFGVAIWDSQKRRLLLARDRLGVKLLYYTVWDGCLWFASEIRALRTQIDAHRGVDPVALYLLLRHRFTPSPLTLIDGIKKLSAGTRLVVSNGRVRIDRWWRFAPKPFSPMPSLVQAEEELAELYEAAVARHLVSDVPVGLLLSGGIDSALLLALMNSHGKGWDTFTVGYGSVYKNDELEDARRTAYYLGARNTQVRIDRQVFERDLRRVVTSLEEPIASASIVPMYHVCQHAREHVKVALIGQGPDELFGGYMRHLGVAYGKYWRRLPSVLRIPAKAILSIMPRSEGVKRGAVTLDIKDRYARYAQVLALESDSVIRGLFREERLPQDADDRIFECWSDIVPLMHDTDELGGLQFLELRSTLPDELLMYADKLSMAHSLELRVPYLDHTIVEYAERLDSSFKVRFGRGKRLHRNVCRRYLPQEIRRRRKRGFAVDVVDGWFRESLSGSLDDTALCNDSLMFGYIERDAVARLVREHRMGRNDHHKVLFTLVCLEEWLRSLA